MCNYVVKFCLIYMFTGVMRNIARVKNFRYPLIIFGSIYWIVKVLKVYKFYKDEIHSRYVIMYCIYLHVYLCVLLLNEIYLTRYLCLIRNIIGRHFKCSCLIVNDLKCILKDVSNKVYSLVWLASQYIEK